MHIIELQCFFFFLTDVHLYGSDSGDQGKES